MIKKAKKYILLIMIACFAMISLTACSSESRNKYMAYKDDIVVATVNGTNIYLSEVLYKKFLNNEYVDGLYTLDAENKYELSDAEREFYKYKTDEEILEEIITDEALFQYAVSLGYEKMSEKEVSAKYTSVDEIDLDSITDRVLGELQVDVIKKTYEVLNMTEDQFVMYMAPIGVRGSLAGVYENDIRTHYKAEHEQASNDEINAAVNSKTDEILKNTLIEKFDFSEE